MAFTNKTLLVALLSTVMVGCAGSSSKNNDQMSDPAVEAVGQENAGAADSSVYANNMDTFAVPNKIYFAFDTSRIEDAANDVIASQAEYFKTNEGKIVITGNCDERGTEEYNLALGEKRARAAKKALVKAGVSASRIEVVTMGKAKADRNKHTETQWKMDRNAEINLANQ